MNAIVCNYTLLQNSIQFFQYTCSNLILINSIYKATFRIQPKTTRSETNIFIKRKF
jgi:hypothetical protein